MEEVQANYPGQQRFGAMRQCLNTIDTRIRQQTALNQQIQANQQQSQSNTQQSSARDRYIYCRLHQSEIQAAERERQRAQGAWSEASGKETPGSLAFEDARQDYEDSVAELERLIPESMRSGLPLIPDAIRQFMTCQFNPAKAD